MRFFRIHTAALALSFLIIPAFLVYTGAPIAQAQTNVTGALAGTVTDPTGSVVPAATVTATSLQTGRSQVTTTSGTGDYRFSQLTPGSYSVAVVAPGFEKAKQTVQVGLGSVAAANLVMTIGQASTTVEVEASEVALVHTEDAQLTTQFSLEQIQNLPNPGNDLTFVAQTAAGSVMNTQSEYGNFSSFGLPGTANTFTINGGYDNDPIPEHQQFRRQQPASWAPTMLAMRPSHPMPTTLHSADWAARRFPKPLAREPTSFTATQPTGGTAAR